MVSTLVRCRGTSHLLKVVQSRSVTDTNHLTSALAKPDELFPPLTLDRIESTAPSVSLLPPSQQQPPASATPKAPLALRYQTSCVSKAHSVWLHTTSNPSFMCSLPKVQRGKAQTTEAAAGGKIATGPGKITGNRKDKGK